MRRGEASANVGGGLVLAVPAMCGGEKRPCKDLPSR